MLIIVLAVVGNLFTTNLYASSFKEQIFKDTTQTLEHARRNADDRMRDIRKTAHLIGANTNLKRLLSDKSDSTTARDYNIFISELRSYQVANSFIKNIFIFPDNKDNVISTTFVRNALYRQQLLSQYTTVDGRVLTEMSDEPHYGDFLLMTERERPSVSSSVVVFLQSLPVDSAKRQDGTLMLVMKSSSLLASLSADSWHEGSVIMVMDSGDNIIASNADATEPFTYSTLEGMPDRFDIDMNGEGHTVLQVTSEITSWKYVVILPTEVMMQDMRNVQKFFLVSIIVTLTLGFIASILLARRNYLPLKILMKTVESDAGIAFGGGENEYKYLRDAMSAALAQKEAQKSAYKNQLMHLRSGYFAGIMKKELDADLSMDDMLKACDISFISDCFALLLINIKNISASPPGIRSEQDDKTTESIVVSVFEEFIHKKYIGFVVNVDDLQSVIWNFPSGMSQEEINEEIVDVTRQCLEFLKSSLRIDITVTASSPFFSLKHLGDAYEDVFTAMEYCTIMGLIGLHFSQDTRYGRLNNETYHYYYPLQLEIQMTNFIKCGDYNGAKRILDNFFHVNFEELSLPYPIMKCFMFNLTSTIMKTIYELNITMADDDELPNSVDVMLACHSASEIYREANRVMAKLCEQQKQSGLPHSFLPETQIYVQKNYSNVNLSISMIADYFNLTPSYLSKKFKSLTGGGLLEYINQIRIDKAKAMLVKTKSNIGHIASSCGFINSNNFIRVFKKYEGITPRSYRDVSSMEP